MNKKILAVAVSMAMFAGASAAMAGEAEVYGKAHVSIDSADNGASGAAAKDSLYMSSNSSRLGVKGAEDLGGGLKAVFQYETTFDVVDGGSISGNRNSYVGLNGGFGTVVAGRHDTPYKTVGRKFDLFGDTVADSRNIINDAGNDLRPGNVLAWLSNDLGGVKLAVAYVLEDGTKNGSATSVSAIFSQGPLMLAGAYQSVEKGIWGTADGSTAFRLGAGYKMGAMKVNALYESDSNAKGVKKQDYTNMGLGVAYKVGSNSFKAQYYMADAEVNSNKNTANMLALGVDHGFSKNTTIYAVYAMMNNDKGAKFNLGGSGHGSSERPASVTGEDPTSISVGLIHKF